MPAIRKTDKQIEKQAKIDEEELALVLIWWNRYASRRDKNALDKLTGEPLPRVVLDRNIKQLANTLGNSANALRAGDLALEDWQILMMDNVLMVQLASAIASAGGIAELTPKLTTVTEESRAFQLDRLTKFAIGIGAGEVAMDGRLMRRAQMYANAGRGMYHEIEMTIQVDDGMTQERSIRTATDSCSECISEEAAQWRPIGSMVPIGQRICLTNCLCYPEYRLKPGSNSVLPAGQGVT